MRGVPCCYKLGHHQHYLQHDWFHHARRRRLWLRLRYLTWESSELLLSLQSEDLVLDRSLSLSYSDELPSLPSLPDALLSSEESRRRRLRPRCCSLRLEQYQLTRLLSASTINPKISAVVIVVLRMSSSYRMASAVALMRTSK
mmetsp:Transcript_1977/g.5066  ORF Transcript_1977/g.5066 Transcript_1977/m.5066 type:complete len:143 (-) Transcript_1977:265-693(-)